MSKVRYSLVAAAAVSAFAVTSAKADVTIATVGPMTGQYASFGEQMKRGAEQAVKDLNAKGRRQRPKDQIDRWRRRV